MKEDAEIKAQRRRSTRKSFPAPLNQIALRHVDAVQSLDGDQKVILADVIAQMGMSYMAACLVAIKSSGDSIKTESDLIAMLHQSKIPNETGSQQNNVDAASDAQGIEEIDTDTWRAC